MHSVCHFCVCVNVWAVRHPVIMCILCVGSAGNATNVHSGRT